MKANVLHVARRYGLNLITLFRTAKVAQVPQGIFSCCVKSATDRKAMQSKLGLLIKKGDKCALAKAGEVQ